MVKKNDNEIAFSMRVVSLLAAINVAVFSWYVYRLEVITDKTDALTLEIARMKSNRFTNKDGQELYRMILELEKTHPPRWFRDRLLRLEQIVSKNH